MWEVLAWLGYLPLHVYRAWVTQVCLLLDTPIGRRSVGGIFFVTSGEIVGQHIKIASYFCGSGRASIDREPFMPASAGQPSLHGCNACTVYWAKGALRRDCRQKQCVSLHGFSVQSEFLGTVLGSNLLAFVGWEGQESWASLPAPSFCC